MSSPLAGAHEVGVHRGLGVLLVVQVQEQLPLVDPGAHRGHLLPDGQGGQHPLAPETLQGQAQGHEGPGDAGGAGAAVGLQDVAVQDDGAGPQALEVHRGPERAADEPADLLGPALQPAPAGLPLRAAVGGARQHGVFGGEPAAAGALPKGRHRLLRPWRRTRPGCDPR